MSKIEQLINELCPEGVEFIKLGDLADIGTGSSDRKDGTEDGIYPFYVRSKEIQRINTYQFDEEAIIIPGEGGIGDIFHYVNGQYALHQRAYRIHLTDDCLITKFVYYHLVANFKKFITTKAVNATVSSIRKPMIEGFPIPVPPLKVQHLIVDVLDSFNELEIALEEELYSRKRQYEYYRDQLLTFDDAEVKWTVMSDVCGIYDGTHQTPKYRVEGVKFVSVENINSLHTTKKFISQEDYIKNYKIKPQINDVFMTRIGTIGSCAVVDTDEDLAYYVTLALIRPDQKVITSKFLKFVIESSIGKKELRKRTLISAVPIKINLGDIGKIRIPIPSIAEQNRIVSILDRLDKLVNDTSEGLPAELKARHNQHTYYNSKLLTFQELNA